MAYQAVYGIVRDNTQAERIVQELINMGFPRDNISFLSQDTGGQAMQVQGSSFSQGRNWRTEERVTEEDVVAEERLTDFPAGTSPDVRESMRRNQDMDYTNSRGTNGNSNGGLGTEKHTKAPEGATTGATTGGIIGGTLGLLAGIGALAIPGLGPFIAAGPLMATLAGIGSGGVVGGIVGALIGSGIPEFEAKRYESRLKEGGILLAIRVNNDEEARRVKELLERHGAEDVVKSSEASVSKNNNNR